MSSQQVRDRTMFSTWLEISAFSVELVSSLSLPLSFFHFTISNRHTHFFLPLSPSFYTHAHTEINRERLKHYIKTLSWQKCLYISWIYQLLRNCNIYLHESTIFTDWQTKCGALYCEVSYFSYLQFIIPFIYPIYIRFFPSFSASSFLPLYSRHQFFSAFFCLQLLSHRLPVSPAI